MKILKRIFVCSAISFYAIFRRRNYSDTDINFRTACVTKLFLTVILFLTITQVNAQNTDSPYNKQLADSLGADEYGMKQYVLVILKTGSSQITDKTILDSLFAGHMQNIIKLSKQGKLVVSGPITKKNDNNYRGIFIFNVTTFEEAKALLEADPAVKEKVLNAELYQWYGSAALPLYVPFHDNIQLKKF